MIHYRVQPWRSASVLSALCSTLRAGIQRPEPDEGTMTLDDARRAELEAVAKRRREVALLAERVQQESRAALALRDEVLTEARA